MNGPASQGLSDEDSAAPAGLAGVVVRGVAFAGTGYLLTQVLTLAFFLVLARLATPADFGQLAAGGVLIGVGLLFTESGMLAAVVQRQDRVEEAANTAVVSTFVAGAGFALLGVAISPLIGIFFGSDRIATVAAAMSGLLLLRSIPIVPAALLQRRFSFARRLVVEPVGVLAFGATAVVTTANDMGVWGLVLGNYAQALTDVVLSWWLVGWRPRLRLASFAIWRELGGYGRHVFTATAVYRAGGQVPIMLLGRFAGAGPLGQYRYANRVASTPFAVMLAAASYVIFPAFARIAADPDRLRSAFTKAMRWMATIGFPAGLILLPLGKPLVVLVFGSVWRDAGAAAMALCLYPAAGAVMSVVAETFKANGRPELLLRMHLFEVVLAALAMLALLRFDLIGVSAGVSIGAVAGAAYALRLAHRTVGVSSRSIVTEIGPPLAAAVVMAGVMFPIEALLVQAANRGTVDGLLLLAAEAVLAAAVYVVTLHLLAPGRIREFAGLARTAVRSRRGDDRAAGLDPAKADAFSDSMSVQ